ncbi:MAG: S1 RNA-binding domain-containing protein [Bacilli bacterium]
MQKFSVGDIVVGKVTGITKYGLFVMVDDIFSGLVHISEMSNGFVKNVSKFASVGEFILVKVIDIKEDKLMLSIKDINYKTKKSCIELVEPKLYVDPKEFEVLKNHLNIWLDEK